MHTIVELPEFLKRARKLLTESERKSVLAFLAMHPKSGVIIKGTGGIRKLRWAFGHKGKSGGVRIVYFFKGCTMPLFLLTVFAKSDQENISKSDRNELKRLVERLVKCYGVKSE
jgi:hypothetical protein